MIAPGVYLIALLLYAALAAAFCVACLILALIPRFRSISLRAAASMMATVPGVFVYQLLSLPLMGILSAAALLVAAVFGYYKDPMALGILALVVAGAFGVVSAVGFVSAWRVAWCALTEQSLTAGWRREFLVVAVRRWRRWKKRGSSHGSPPPQPLLGRGVDRNE